MIPDNIKELVDWIPKKRFQEIYGESDDAIKKRISEEYWQAGVHYSRPAGAGVWFSMKAINEWAAKHTPDARFEPRKGQPPEA